MDPQTMDALGESTDSSATPQTSQVDEFRISTSLEDLQTEEQRVILDMVALLRKCGLESILSLPQLVVCGDQSAGKSSVLEALTEIPFPRNDNLCTRFATEIILRHGPVNSLTIRAIPDDARPRQEKESIKAFAESITDFNDLPRIMDLAMAVMGIPSGNRSAPGESSAPLRAFAKDTLSIEIEGPSRPQLTLVDIPGLIQTSTKGVTDADVELVAEITDSYISQPRTICLAVVSAANDAANQIILRKVQRVDPQGDRTLGIITKPDLLPAGSGSETKFLELARNEDVFLKLGWHVVKNRCFDENNFSLDERNHSEAKYFRKSNFSSLPKENLGVEALRGRLSLLLFEHVKKELPKLRQDLEDALCQAEEDLSLLGPSRSRAAECRAYLAQLSLNCYELSKAAVNGYYEGEFFRFNPDEEFSHRSNTTIPRLRAVIQHMNTEFSNTIRTRGYKFHIDLEEKEENPAASTSTEKGAPTKLSKEDALDWVRRVLLRTRGKELIGNFNPLLIGELFWEQSGSWKQLSIDHVEETSRVCERFLSILLDDKAPKDVKSRLWSSKISDALKARRRAAFRELDLIIEDNDAFPINYNHSYTDTIFKRRQERNRDVLDQALESGMEHRHLPGFHPTRTVDVDKVVEIFSRRVDPVMENFSCEDALDCLLPIYKVMQKTFVANVTTQVVERHIVRGLERIFSPLVVSAMSDAEVEAAAAEPPPTRRRRDFLADRIRKLEDGRETFRAVMGSAAK